MNLSFCRSNPIPLISVKNILKQYRWYYRRFLVASKVGPEILSASPAVFGNAMPKSGSHLLTQVLCGLTRVGAFVNPGFPPVNRDERNQSLEKGQIINNLHSMKPGDIRYGYLHAAEPFLSIFRQPKYAVFFIYRDPRDMLISHIFYAKDMYPGHGMHRYYSQRLHTMEARINAAIKGVNEPGFELASVKQRYESYQGWFNEAHVLCIKFEDLILKRTETLERMLEHLQNRGATLILHRSAAIEILDRSISPAQSGTFRRGTPGEWREHFSERNKAVFRQVAGDLLQQLGYEESHQW